MIVNLREVIRLSPAALERACGADESWQAPREVDVNQKRERGKLGRHSAACGRFAAFARPHARATGRADKRPLHMPIARMRLRMQVPLDIALGSVSIGVVLLFLHPILHRMPTGDILTQISMTVREIKVQPTH
jgi:hypothetical protein